MMLDDTVIVVIGRNEGARLLACLASAKSEAKNIVYVNSGSTDGSSSAALGFGAFVVELDSARPFTAARARNEGFRALKAMMPDVSFVQFLDGDCTLAKNWLRTGHAFLQQRDDVAVVCGRLRERNPSASLYNELCDLEWNTPVGEASASGGNTLIRVAAFEAIAGFNPSLIAGEEPELCLRLREKGWKIWRIAAEMGLHDAAMTRFGQWWLRSVRWGYALAEISQLHRKSPSRIWKREIATTLFWGFFLPIAICVGAVFHPVVLTGLLVYLLKLCRVAFRRGATSVQSWIVAVFGTLANFPACQGMLKYYWGTLRGQVATWIEYK